MHILPILVCLILSIILSACSIDGETNYAPVMDVSTIEPIPKDGAYKVIKGDTLYSIAWRYSLDYRTLARRNHLQPPYAIHPGQIIYLRGQISSPILKNEAESGFLSREPTVLVTKWRWPAHGPVINGFSEFNKGINIGGRQGDPVYSTAPGKVVYSGNGLRGYGNLIIIKHNSTYLTAYAHNSMVYVKEGDHVRGRQKIAEMGKTGSRRVMLHFEIRRNGNPVNPLSYLSGNN